MASSLTSKIQSTTLPGEIWSNTRKMANQTEMLNQTNFTTTLPPPENIGIYQEVAKILVIVAVIIAVLAAVENLLALAMFFRKSTAVITERGGFTISLAAADFMLASSPVIQHIVLNLPPDKTGNINHDLFAKAMIILDWGSITASMWSLYSLVMDRYLSVRCPFDHERRIPKSWIPLICLLIWLLSFVVNSLYIIIMEQEIYIVVTLVPRIPPATGTIIIYLLIHCIAVSSRRRLSRQRSERSMSQEGVTSWSTRLRDVKKSVLMFSVTCSLQLFGAITCATIQAIQLVKCGLFCDLIPENDPMFITQDLAMIVILLSAAINPWIHTFRQRELWRPCCRRLRTDNRSYTFTRPNSSRTERYSAAD